jgi:hypothetical protein
LLPRWRLTMTYRLDPATWRAICARYPTELQEKLAACGAPIRDKNVHRCRSPACPTCCRLRGRAEARRALTYFADADHANMVLVTVSPGFISDLVDWRPTNRKFVSDTRNLINRQRREWPRRWGGVSLYGWPEVDPIAQADLPILPSRIRSYVEAARPCWRGEWAWMPHWHLVADTGGVDWQELRDVFAERWPLPGQVDVRPLDPAKGTRDQNISRIARYANKFGVGKSWDGVWSEWSPVAIAEMRSWMALDGWNEKRFLVKPKASRGGLLRVADDQFEAMPMLV